MTSMTYRRPLGLVAAALLVAGLAACGGGDETPTVKQTSANNGGGPRMGAYKVGAPYQVDGTWYYPREDYDYDETGVASWYGPDFDGKSTANGETYDMGDLTAAHRTLPLPSIVRVTNLENGKSLVLRINDRGPFAKSRIIDVSKRAAIALGFHDAGTTRVRVQILADESRSLKAQILTASGDMPKLQAAPTPTLVAQPIAPPPGESPVASSPPAATPAPVATASVVTASPPPVIVQPAVPPASSASPDDAYRPPKPGTETGGAIPVTPLDGTNSVEATPIPQAPAAVAVAPVPAKKKVAAVKVAPTYAVPGAKPMVMAQGWVQAGTYRDKDKADAMKVRLTGLKGVNITQIQIGGLPMYRVRLGPVFSQADANRLLGAVQARGVAEARLVAN